MIKNIMTFIVVASLLSTMSCKKNDGNNLIVLDSNNMVVAKDQSGQMDLVPKKIMNPREYPKIEIENSDFDFGDIEQGDIVSHVFKFRNIGKNDLVILDAHASCGCTVPDWTKTPVKNGERGEVKITFNSSGKSGLQQKTVTLRTNTADGNEIINFKANINPKKGRTPAKTK